MDGIEWVDILTRIAQAAIMAAREAAARTLVGVRARKDPLRLTG